MVGRIHMLFYNHTLLYHTITYYTIKYYIILLYHIRILMFIWSFRALASADVASPPSTLQAGLVPPIRLRLGRPCRGLNSTFWSFQRNLQAYMLSIE